MSSSGGHGSIGGAVASSQPVVHWKIIETYPNSDGLIRRVKIRVSRCKERSKMKIGVAELDRPISKLVLLRANDNSAEDR